MSADQRLTAAREFLAGTRKHKVAELPPSALMRECAELRRLLGQVLDVLAERREVLAHVIADAVAYRGPTGQCEDCEAHPANLCEDHAADLDRADDYLALALELGIEVDR
jgi:hypothetical protein